LELVEASLNRIYQKTKNHAVGAVTAFRGDKTKAENKSNNKKVLAYLMNAGYSVIKVKGSYLENYGSETQKEVGEESFFVANYKIEGDDDGQLERDLIKLGRLYDQDSILSVPFEKKGYLYGTSKRDDAFPDYGQKVVVGKPVFGDAKGEFFSRVKGRKFAFESYEEASKPMTYNGKWAISLYAKEIREELKKLED
tara:strand:+ start:5286 stop:5873 length:588 start_codon:yes stop_codon:yes gene_type:complete